MALKYIGKNYAGNDAYLESEFAAPWFVAWLRRFKSDHPSIPVVVVQAYGFARASAGVHSGGWCVDFQIWHLTNTQIRALIRHLRAWGASASWERDSRDGMEPHIHATIDSEGRDKASWYQIAAVKAGLNGLVNNARDRYADLNPTNRLTVREALAALEEVVSITREEMNMIANLTATEVCASSLGSRGNVGQLITQGADHFANGEAAAVSVWNSKMGEAGTAQNLLWRAGVEAPNAIQALDNRLSAVEAGMQKIISLLEAR